jgi:hypothetical protein
MSLAGHLDASSGAFGESLLGKMNIGRACHG